MWTSFGSSVVAKTRPINELTLHIAKKTSIAKQNHPSAWVGDLEQSLYKNFFLINQNNNCALPQDMKWIKSLLI